MHAPIHGHRNSTPAPASAGSRPALRLSRARAPLRPTHTNAAAVTDAPSDQEPRSSAPQEDVSDDSLVFDVPEAIWERNRAFAQRLKGKVILAPLTRGGNLPYRELCVAHGCEATMSGAHLGSSKVHMPVLHAASYPLARVYASQYEMVLYWCRFLPAEMAFARNLIK